MGTTPFVPLDGVTVNTPLQIVVLICVIDGLGSTATVTKNVLPTHKLVAGVTVYIALYVVFVGFVTVPNTFVVDIVDATPPDNDAFV